MAERLKRLSDDEPDRGEGATRPEAGRYQRVSDVHDEPRADRSIERDRGEPRADRSIERDRDGRSTDGFRDLIDGWIGRNRNTGRHDRAGADGGRAPRERAGRGGDNAVAVVALVLGVAAVGGLLLSAGWLFFLSLPLGVAAVVLGVRGKRRVDRGASSEHRAPAKAAIALGATAIVLSLVALALLVAFGAALGQGLDVLSSEADRQKREQSQGAESATRRSQEQREELARRSQQQREELARRAQAQREELRRRAAERRKERS